MEHIIFSKSSLLVILVGFSFALSAQTIISSGSESEENWLKYADKSFKEKDYYGSAYYYKLALDEDSLDLDIWWRLAESHRLSFNYKKAQKNYESLIELDEKIRYPEATFYLAEMLKVQEKYEEAEQYFEFFLDISDDRSSTLYRRAKVEIKACILAKGWKDMTSLWEIEHAPFGVNSFDAEFGPFILNENQLLFSALRFDTKETKQITEDSDVYKSKIFLATLEGEKWNSVALDNMINDSLTDNANPAISPDSSQIYFTRCDDKGCAIWVSNWYEDHWENAAKLGPNINSENATSTHPFVAKLKNGKSYLFFSSNRSRTRGNMDIWSVEIKGNGTKFGRPKNAGRKVNSKDDEITPYYNTETEELYFSSLWHIGFGGFDIFKSKGYPGKFQAPTNVGKPINSSVNDMYYNYSNTTKSGAFISNRSDGYALKGETCCNDIYFFKERDTTKIEVPKDVIPPNEDLVVKLQAVQFLPLALYFDNDHPNPRTKQITTDKNYEETYNSYLARREKFRSNAPNKAAIDSFFVNDVEVGFTKLQMLADSLIKYLGKGYKLQLGIKGYTSPLGNTEYNDNLALRRINAIENYLYTCKNGALQEAIETGYLKFRQIPFGEFFSLGKVNDDYNSQKQSVYSAAASEARKVEIIWVEQTLPGDSRATIIFEKTTFNFQTLPRDAMVEHTFKFTNSGEVALVINSVVGDCDCIISDYPKIPINPGESGEITIKFNTSGRKGLQFHAIMVNSNASVNEKKLFVRGVMKVIEIEEE